MNKLLLFKLQANSDELHNQMFVSFFYFDSNIRKKREIKMTQTEWGLWIKVAEVRWKEVKELGALIITNCSCLVDDLKKNRKLEQIKHQTQFAIIWLAFSKQICSVSVQFVLRCLSTEVHEFDRTIPIKYCKVLGHNVE